LIQLLKLFFVLFLATYVQAELRTFEKGVSYYNERGKKAIGLAIDPSFIDSAIKIFSEVSYQKEEALESKIFLLKSYYFKGKFGLNKKEEKKKIFNKGKVLGERLIQDFPESAGANYWYLVNLGSWAEEYGLIAAAREGTADLMLKYSTRIIKLDPVYANGGGYFLLGAVHFKAPRIPFILSWPDNNKAVKYLTLACEKGTPTPPQIVYLARSLYKKGEKNKAKELLNKLLLEEISNSFLIEDLEQHQIAMNLLKKWT